MDQVVKATNVGGTLHMHHCINGNGDHDDEWQRHAHDHGRQLLRVLADSDVARCFKNKSEVTEHQATTRTKPRRARESVNLAMQSPPRRKKEREDKIKRPNGEERSRTCTKKNKNKGRGASTKKMTNTASVATATYLAATHITWMIPHVHEGELPLPPAK